VLTRPRKWLPKRLVEIHDTFKYEVATTWGLLWQRRYTGNELDYMQVGSGKNQLPGFLNADHYLHKKAAFRFDLRHPLPFDDERWTGIHAHHCIEHLAYSKALGFFREARRILRPGGTLRVVVPDAETVIRMYAAPEKQRMEQLSGIVPSDLWNYVQPKTALGIVNFIFYCGDYNHLCAWDFESLSGVLKECGFPAVERTRFGKSRDPKMCNIDVHADWESHSLYVEATKGS